ncbi:MAG: type II toxin-antitoxin system RelB/DinJ family antitoxin [Synergistaceae bacterium]|nr:type II toxin-antitoxin system RelB/DinJ family antitoxin [Synergistaceae bacterium]
MAQTTLSVRMDENVKRQFDAFCDEVGMNASVAVNLFAKAVIRAKKLPFEIAADAALPRGDFRNRSSGQKKALEKFWEGLSDCGPLPPEFDEIMSKRVNITRELDL